MQDRAWCSRSRETGVNADRSAALPKPDTSREQNMLYLTRKMGESIIIDDKIEIVVVEVRGKTIKLGFSFPEGVSVLRRELHERIRAERLASAE
jgi:carbon storage regulator CsrA